MKRKKAIEILKHQKSKLKKPGFTVDPWIDEMSTYLTEIFGKESEQYRQLMELDFKEDYPKIGLQGKISSIDGTPIYNDIDNAEQFIDNLIEQITKIGLPKKRSGTNTDGSVEKRSGIFINYSLLTIICTLLIALFSGLFMIGRYFGIKKFDMEKEDLYKEVEHWKTEYNKVIEIQKIGIVNPDTTIVD